MRIAVLTDIHANLVGLQAVMADLIAWQPDRVIVAGDIINRGPRPRECLEIIQEKQRTDGWLTVRGNHEDYVIAQAQPDAPRSGPAAQVHLASMWTRRQIGDLVHSLPEMPNQQDITDPDGHLVRTVHASIKGNRIGIYPETSDQELHHLISEPTAQQDGPPIKPVVFCAGHTHRPLIRRLNGCLVINAGSAGLCFDGDPRLSYARLIWCHNTWTAEIIRLSYDQQRAVRDFYDTGYYFDAGPLIRLVMIELLEARSLLYGWATQYQNRVLSGAISMEESVKSYLSNSGIDPG
jgi:predicted phosphodiesterase